MGKNKLKKFAQVAAYDHVIEPTLQEMLNTDHRLKGRWHEEFGNDHPVTLELACGKGEYTIGQARLFPGRNFIGMDIKGARLFSGAKAALDEGLGNVRFVRTRIDLISALFAAGEVAEIWITFADPQMEKPRKRLTSGLFLDRYVRFLKPGGSLNLKSDSTDLYEYTRNESIPEFNAAQERLSFEKTFDTTDVYGEGIKRLDPVMQDVLNIRTFYESMWLEQGKKIKYLQYTLTNK